MKILPTESEFPALTSTHIQELATQRENSLTKSSG